MAAGEKKVNDIGVIVGEARSALNEIRSGASNAADLVSASAEISQAQAERAESLASKMSQFAANSARWSLDVNETAEAMSAQITALKDLEQANKRLVDSAERLRKKVARCSTPRAEHASPAERDD